MLKSGRVLNGSSGETLAVRAEQEAESAIQRLIRGARLDGSYLTRPHSHFVRRFTNVRTGPERRRRLKQDVDVDQQTVEQIKSDETTCVTAAHGGARCVRRSKSTEPARSREIGNESGVTEDLPHSKSRRANARPEPDFR